MRLGSEPRSSGAFTAANSVNIARASATLSCPSIPAPIITGSKSFQEPGREAWELSAADRLEQAEKLKARGTEDMRAAKWEAARQSYREAAGLLDGFSADATLLFTEREALDAATRGAGPPQETSTGNIRRRS